jgi:hypothetical protein
MMMSERWPYEWIGHTLITVFVSLALHQLQSIVVAIDDLITLIRSRD